MPILRGTEPRGYIVCAADIVAQVVDVSSSTFPVDSLDSVALDSSFDRLHVCSNFVYWAKETIFKRRLKTRRYSCSFINWHCVDVYAIPALIRLKLFVYVPDWQHA